MDRYKFYISENNTPYSSVPLQIARATENQRLELCGFFREWHTKRDTQTSGNYLLSDVKDLII